MPVATKAGMRKVTFEKFDLVNAIMKVAQFDGKQEGKRWFDDWHYYYSPGNKLTLYLPNSATKPRQITITTKQVGEDRLETLFNYFSSAFDQIQTDHGGYKHD